MRSREWKYGERRDLGGSGNDVCARGSGGGCEGCSAGAQWCDGMREGVMEDLHLHPSVHQSISRCCHVSINNTPPCKSFSSLDEYLKESF